MTEKSYLVHVGDLSNTIYIIDCDKVEFMDSKVLMYKDGSIVAYFDDPVAVVPAETKMLNTYKVQ